jgi:catechol 1,2-dioxygenase
MKRRSFLQKSSVVAMSVSAFGIVRWDGNKYTGNTPTTTDILGPFYRPNAPVRSNIIPAGSKGTPMNLVGKVYAEDGVAPLKDALIEIWQCDEKAYYDNTSDDYLFRGASRTGNKGEYAFKTIIPVPYKVSEQADANWRPAHIHIRVSSKDQQDLITQIYFKGDQYLEKDRSSSSPQAVNRILEITKNSSGENTVNFDVVMRKHFPLDAEVYRRIAGLYDIDNSIIEFVQDDDLLLVKVNGQFMSALNYVGNNTFQDGGDGSPKVVFELLASGGVNATVTMYGKTTSGEKFLKYR